LLFLLEYYHSIKEHMHIYRRMGIELGLNHAHYLLAFTVRWEIDHDYQQLILGVAVESYS